LSFLKSQANDPWEKEEIRKKKVTQRWSKKKLECSMEPGLGIYKTVNPGGKEISAKGRG